MEGLDECGKYYPTLIRSPDLPACNNSVYRLSYPGPPTMPVTVTNGISHNSTIYTNAALSTRWFKYDRDKLWPVYTQSVPVIFEPPCMLRRTGVALMCLLHVSAKQVFHREQHVNTKYKFLFYRSSCV